MNAAARSFVSVMISGFIVWIILNSSRLFSVPWWAFLFMLGVTYLVVDTTLQALQERIRTH
jgi:hypothetical protein